jgi:hypothetical protein
MIFFTIYLRVSSPSFDMIKFEIRLAKAEKCFVGPATGGARPQCHGIGRASYWIEILPNKICRLSAQLSGGS